jgi:hypothetical protein
MSCFRTFVLLLFAAPVWAAEGYVVGAGVDIDSGDALAGGLSGEIGVTENTWLSAVVAKTTTDLPRGTSLDTLYADFGIDHWFDPVGIRATVAYWGDSDILDSIDYRGALYWRNEKVTLTGRLEHRDFSFDIFRGDLRPGQDIEFHSTGAGLSAAFQLGESVDLSFSAIDYNYDVNLRIDANRPILDFLTVSRLSLINSLVDYRARVGVGVDVGERRWSLDLATWKGEVDGRMTKSATLRFITPLGDRSDIDLGLGVDDSDEYGSVTVFSFYLYFYG